MSEHKKSLYQQYLDGEPFDLAFQDPASIEDRKILRRFQPQQRLIILGGGYVAQSLCRFASALEFEVIVADDRASFANKAMFPMATGILCDTFPAAVRQIRMTASDYVAVVTRGHRHDADCLRMILQGTMPLYLGLIGSKRRVQGLFRLLEEEGYPRECLGQVHAPIGLDIGAVTTDEIAISILAELIQIRSISAQERKTEILEQTNVDPVFLECLWDGPEKAVAVVVGCQGSTPVKTGAIMAVSRLGQTYGTVGGGCGEHEVVMAALRVLRNRKSERITVDMTNDVAEEEGMVCGGMMQVLICLEHEVRLGML